MNNIKIEIKWALIFALTTLVWMLIEKLSGLHDIHIDKHSIVSMFFMIPAIAIYVFAFLDKRKNFYQGRMTYKQGFICGLIITAFVTLLTPLTQYITSEFITPDYFANAIKYSIDKGEMTEVKAKEYFSLKSYILQSTLFAPIMGIVTSAIVAIFTKQKSNQ